MQKYASIFEKFSIKLFREKMRSFKKTKMKNTKKCEIFAKRFFHFAENPTAN